MPQTLQEAKRFLGGFTLERSDNTLAFGTPEGKGLC